MRLVNVNTLKLEEFFNANIPRYAILSHTWGKDEVTFQDLDWLKDYEKNQTTYASLEPLIFQLGQNPVEKASALRRTAGFDKIVQSARVAKHRGLQYVWVDTCCIDKTSSAELSEAINSMYRWYSAAESCFAFLSDVVHCEPSDEIDIPSESGFEQSRWFTRGWTLQELLAPVDVSFLDRDWQYVASKRRNAKQISRITGIPVDILRSPAEAGNKSVAQRMSWASGRETSRSEDMAYCLLGIFGINMPLLYGEGARAFIRLQQEIAREHSDQSLFAWGLDQEFGEGKGTIFATSPGQFAGAGEVMMAPKSSMPTFHLNNKGLEITLHLFQLHPTEWETSRRCRPFYHAMLESWVYGAKGEEYAICLPMFRVRDQEWDPRSGEEMIRFPSGPVKILVSYIPRGVVPVTVVVLKEPPPPLRPSSGSCFFSIEAADHRAPDAVGADMGLLLVETYPPPLQVERSTPGSLAFRCQRPYGGTYVLRFVVAAEPTRQFIVTVQTENTWWPRTSVLRPLLAAAEPRRRRPSGTVGNHAGRVSERMSPVPGETRRRGGKARQVLRRRAGIPVTGLGHREREGRVCPESVLGVRRGGLGYPRRRAPRYGRARGLGRRGGLLDSPPRVVSEGVRTLMAALGRVPF
ncbi:HET domain-containing protein [Colletotrichum musicola]|uniref:HET domain-containing protein n=1 Tax=Colletotrichum musicola TaxID=2175873 RepID=A0A8H6NKV6_9PEZI|nr:HET domain-containing protein [Colletotrichum musicola]